MALTEFGSFQEPTKHQSSLRSCLEDSRVSSHGEERYLTRPLVSRNLETKVDRLPEKPTTNGLKNIAENIGGCHEEVNDKIRKTLKLLTLRDRCNLIQFWAPCTFGKYKLLKTIDQPFGLGTCDEGLCNFRRKSESNMFHVDEECKEEDLAPIVRVFRRGLPEWTSDITNYSSKNYPHQNCAIRWNLHGYLVLPVFDSFTRLCVGVLESITSSKYIDCAYEVQEVHRIFKTENLTTPQAFDYPTSNVHYDNKQHELDEIFRLLKDVCDTHKLPLAQTWTVSSRTSYVATGRNIEKTCSSFNISCIGKICLSTTALPFYVQDLRFWHFREACREHHLIESKGVVGRTLSSHGSCFCGDVTKLEEEEYALVHNARMSGLTSCFAIYLHSHEHDDSYVLEFFLPVDMKEDADLHNLVQKVKMHVGVSSFKLGDLLSTEVIRMPMELSNLAPTKQLHSIHTSLSREITQVYSKDSHTVEETNAQIDSKNAQDQCDFGQVSHKNKNSAITNTEEMYVDDVTSKIFDIETVEKGYVSREKRASTKRRRQQKVDSHTSEHIQKYVRKSIGEASMNLGCLSREIMQIDSEDSQTSEETSAQIDYINFQDQHDCTNSYPKNWSSVITNTEEMSMDDTTSQKIDSLTSEHIQNHSGKPIGEISTSFASLSREIVQKDSKDSEIVEEINAQINCLISQHQHVLGSGYQNNWSSAITNTEKTDADNVISKKTDAVTAEKRYNSGEMRASAKRKRKRKLDSITPETIQEHFGKPIGEASRRLGVSRSTLKRVCRQLNIPSWPLPDRNKKHAHFGLSGIVFLVVKIKRWSCSSNHPSFSARWWICGKHNDVKSKLSLEAHVSLTISNPSAITHYFSQLLKESDESIETVNLFSKPPQACFGIYEASCLLIGLKRWRKRTMKMHAMTSNGYLVNEQLSDTFDMFHASPKKNVVYVSDTKMVTVKATFKDDMIKFQFPLSSGLSVLKNQVAQRFKLKETSIHLKYMDEDDDLILIACDADFRNFMPFSATSVNNTMKLIVQMSDV